MQLSLAKQDAESWRGTFIITRDGADELVMRMGSQLTEARTLLESMAEALEYQKTALRKIVEGSMFTPQSERDAAEKKIDAALTRFDEWKNQNQNPKEGKA